MARNIKKLLSFVLALVMVLSMIPAVSATEETTEPETAGSEVTESAADAIQIGTADEWNTWFLKTTSKLISDYSGKDEVAKFVLTADISVAPDELYYFGNTKGAKVNAEIDLGGYTLTIGGTKLLRVFGIYDGSNLTIKNGTILLEKAFGEVHGGLFFANNGTLNLSDMTITDVGEDAFNCNGKLMHILATATANLTNVNMTGNTVQSTSRYKSADGSFLSGIGGLISVAGTLNADGCSFTATTTTAATEPKNMLQYGGLIGVEGGKATLTNCTLTGGFARFGGALSARTGTATATNCTFQNSKAYFGGAVHTENAALVTLKDSTITGATADSRGGGVHTYNASTSTQKTLEMINTDITGCSAPDGGGIASFGRSVINITGGTISNCTATGAKGHGGGMYIINKGYTAGTNKVTIKDTVFDGCTAAEAGNIHVENTSGYTPNTLDMTNVTLKNGVATSPSGVSGYGGNLYVVAYDLVRNGVTYHCTVNMTGCTIEGGESKHGANIGVAGQATLNITNSVVRDGHATTGGGNLYMGNADAKVNIYDSTFMGGTGDLYGGNIRVGKGILKFYSGLIEGGEAESFGKTLHVSGADAYMYVYGGTIRATAGELAVSQTNGTLKLLNCETENFDPAAFAPYGEAYATQTSETTAVVKHYAVDDATTKTGSCEEAGTVTIVCPDCEYTYVYEETAAGHAIVIDKAVAPTCTETGLTEGRHCALCDQAAVAQEEVAATGHTAGEPVRENEVAHTCTEDGSYDSVVYCEGCEIELSRETGVIDPAAHTEKIVEGKAPTCTETGLTEGKVCEICGETLVAQEEIPAAHTEKIVEGKDPTCTETGLTEGKVCEICGETLVAQEEIPVAEHAWDEGVYTDPTTEADGYTTYTCTACGETKVEINEGSKLPEIIPAVITKQPEAMTVNSGEKAVFHVEVEGEVVSYKWQYRKVWKWFNTTMDGYNTDTLTVSAKGRHNGYDYKCTITFADGTVLETTPAELTVNTTITITYQPNNQLVAQGAKGQFTVAAQGEGLKYVWEYYHPVGERWIETTMEGNTRETVMIQATAGRDGYKYRCKVTDEAGMVVYTEPATMTVLTVAEQPEDVFTAPGEKVTFTVAGSVAEGYSYQWQYYTGTRWTDTNLAGYNTATLTVSARLNINGRQYRCVLTGDKNSKIESEPATLHVGDPIEITAQPQSVTVEQGTATVQLTVEATNVYSYQWWYSDNGTKWYTTGNEGNKTATLTAKVKNGRMYKCIMKGLNGESKETEIATITVIAVQ